MRNFSKLLFVTLLSAGLLFFLGAFRPTDTVSVSDSYITDGEQSPCHQTDRGPVIDWRSDYKLRYEDFKGDPKGNPAYAVATTSSAFGYSITDRGGEISGSIYVRFYCEESWWNPDYRTEEVREHEQLHFDICEVFGRKFYKAVLVLRDSGNLNSRSMRRIKSKFEKQYDDCQLLYDSETDHGTKEEEQSAWNQKIKRELDELSDFADYASF